MAREQGKAGDRDRSRGWIRGERPGTIDRQIEEDNYLLREDKIAENLRRRGGWDRRERRSI